MHKQIRTIAIIFGCILLCFMLTADKKQTKIIAEMTTASGTQYEETVKRFDVIDEKLDSIQKQLNVIEEKQDKIAGQYLIPAEGKVFFFWPGGEELNYDNFYTIVKSVVDAAPFDIKDKEGMIALIIETASVESFFGFRTIQKNGHALGVFQMEPKTFKCIYSNYLKFNPEIKKFVSEYEDKKCEKLYNLRFNLPYQVACCLTMYQRYGIHKEALPTREERAKVYKKVWNTHAGVATLDKFYEDTTKYLEDYYTNV